MPSLIELPDQGGRKVRCHFPLSKRGADLISASQGGEL
jgi:ACT domain-containing protein